ncbi:hypothetical protein N7488_010933 [Penicillium malachiteum]|nr:hypothetical protein N7488_010933 [Penicillium malachiteum]
MDANYDTDDFNSADLDSSWVGIPVCNDGFKRRCATGFKLLNKHLVRHFVKRPLNSVESKATVTRKGAPNSPVGLDCVT